MLGDSLKFHLLPLNLRFEEEIGLPIPEGPILGAGPRRIIGANTYNEAQKTLAANVPGSIGPGEMGLPLGGIPPPPPPPPLPFVPSKVRSMPPSKYLGNNCLSCRHSTLLS